MDELVRHCIRELSFDGDLGCDVSRLREFIAEFYSTSQPPKQQNIDDAFCAFLWSVIVHQPGVLVGVAPEGAHNEVYVAPQPSSKRKGKLPEDAPDPALSTLSAIPDAATKSLVDLQQEYGDKLRIAVDPETTFVALTGSHIRPAKLTPMVYTALQLVSRGRDKGISVVDLSKKTGYDPKTCHYLVDKLLELNYIEKRKKSGVGSNFCIHKYFFDRSPTWKTVLAEEAEANAIDQLKTELDDDGEGNQEPSSSNITFEPIDLRHLSSLPLVRARVVKLLKASPHQMHTTHNLLVTVGFANPTKSDRRFFATRLRELMAQGLIEKVQVPHAKRKNALVTCIRLLNPEEKATEEEEMVIDPMLLGKEQDSGKPLKANRTLHKQIIDLVAASGTQGMTLNELTASLCNFDKRIVELLLSRLEKYSPPPHLADLGITQLTETHGRERRFRYFTLKNYRVVAEKEKFDASHYSEIDISQAGGFLPLDPSSFYETQEDLNDFVDDFKITEFQPTRPKSSASTTPKKSRAPKKKSTASTPSEKKAKVKTPRGTKRKREEVEDDESKEVDELVAESASTAPPPPKKRRGRPPKNKPVEDTVQSQVEPEASSISAPPPTPVTQKKKRGRPPKARRSDVTANEETTSELQQPTPKRTRTSRRKSAVVELPIEQPPLSGEDVTTTQELPQGEAEVSLEKELNQEQPVVPTPVVEESISSICCADKSPAPPEVIPKELAPTDHTPVAQPTDHVPIDPRLFEDSNLISMGSVSSSLTPIADDNLQELPSATTSQQISVSESRDVTRNRGNISQSRRENEFMQIINDFGGIVNISSKDFLDAHSTLLDNLSKKGAPVSTRAGSRIDKRTVESTLRSLESRDKIKIITTIVSSLTGASRTVKVVYLPTISEEELATFLAEVGRNLQIFPLSAPNIKTLDEPLEYGGLKIKNRAINLDRDVDPAKNAEKAQELFKCNEETIREALLTERTTLAQLYGFIGGRALRAKYLHLLAVRLFDESSSVGSVVSLEQRILHLSYFYSDISVANYCALVSCLFYSEELLQILSSSFEKEKPMSQLPTNLQNALQSSKSRSQARLLDLLVLLQSLGLVVPLQPSKSNQPALSCQTRGQHPTAFDVAAAEGWATLAAPQYWRFNINAPIHLWALSESSPSLWKEVPVVTENDVKEYWEELRQASINSEFAREAPTLGGAVIPNDLTVAAGRCLRRATSWKTSYNFSYFQNEYLKRFLDNSTGATPLQAEQNQVDGQINHISWVVCAPPDVVRAFFEHEHERVLHDIQRVRKKEKKRLQERRAKEEEKNGEDMLARKAEQAKQKREQEWTEMVHRLHPTAPEPVLAARLRRIQTKFMQGVGGTDPQKWEREILTTIQDVRVTAPKAVLPSRSVVQHEPKQFVPPPPPVPVPSADKSVEDLIEQQGPPATQRRTKKKKGKAVDTEPEPERRRHRFQWNKDYDELARDASVIIKARCRDGKRIDWAALEQVFPAVPRNSVRQRIGSLREQPGADTYFKRLEDKFYDLWVKHRGTDILPDEDIESVSNFDMIAHVKFLRNHIDKNAIRVGYLEDESSIAVTLPATVEAFERTWEITEKPITAPTWDFLWTFPSEESREKGFAHQAFLRDSTDFPEMQTYAENIVQVADTALKMALGTPSDVYDPDVAAALLKSVGDEPVRKATVSMLDRGILSRIVRDPSKARPGRTLRISEANQNALGGSISEDIFQDAAELEDTLTQQEGDTPEWREWSLLAVDGDAAALTELVSKNQVEFKVDTTQARSARPKLDWNSKKADDDDIETKIQIRFHASRSTQSTSPDATNQEKDGQHGSDVYMSASSSSVIHGLTSTGEDACCKQTSSGLIDCEACLNQEKERVLGVLNEEERQWAFRILTLVEEAKEGGLKKSQLQTHFSASETDLVKTAILKLSTCTIPLLFWTGYSDIVLVSSNYASKWSVALSSGTESKRVVPKRWYDIHGRQIGEVWEAALRAVMSIILYKPGVSQTEIRWRLKGVYDRQEINEVLEYLLEDGFLRREAEGGGAVGVGPMDDGEERYTFWMAKEKKEWYQL
ncbi:hypothetical protein C8Q75DRAFT_304194 [Abortiporus biennis]|nr:hypothetical protein C8Q75DRAFT_304194 [Abortiporus biennis]